VRLKAVIAGVVMLMSGAAWSDSAGQRVVSADGSLTETLYALGAGDLLVAVDTTSNYPPATEDLPRVGYLRALPFEGILAMAPDVLITSTEAAPEKTLTRLDQAGVEVVRLPRPKTPGQVLERTLEVGRIVGHEAEAERLVAAMDTRIRRVLESGSFAGHKVLFLMAAGSHGVMIAGRETAADDLLQILGADNAAPNVLGYKPANREAVLASGADAIVVAETAPGQFRIDDWPQLRALEAWQEGRYLVADSMMMLGFGPRLPEALEALAGVLGMESQVAGHGS